MEATVIGEFTDTNRLELFYDCDVLSDLSIDHDGNPRITKQPNGDQYD